MSVPDRWLKVAYPAAVNPTTFAPLTGRPILSLRTFTKQAGISDTTAWRWRRNGWLVTVNIAGRPYLTDKSLGDFLRRVEAGESAKPPRPAQRRS